MHRSSRLPALARALAPLLAIAIAPGMVLADGARAKELFGQARTLYKQESYAEACPLFEESEKLEPALGTELNLALCWAKVGRLLDAARMFDLVIGKTAAPAEAARRKLAEEGAREVAQRLPRVQIDRGSLSVNARVAIDGTALIETDEPIPVDPGEHTVTGEGAKPVTFTAEEGKVAQVTLVAIAVASGDTEPVTPARPARSGMRDKLPFYLGAGGATLVAASLVTGIITLSKKSSGLDKCDDTGGPLVCTPEGTAELDAARTFSHVSTGLFVVGAGLLGAGIYLHVRDRKTAADSAPPITGWVTGTSAGMAWGTTW